MAGSTGRATHTHTIAKYIRRVKGGKFQLRPHLDGVRYNLGLFPSEAEARRALQDFWWGRLKEAPRYTRSVYSLAGPYFTARVPLPDGGWRPLGRFAVRDLAAAAVLAALTSLYGPVDGPKIAAGEKNPPRRKKAVAPPPRLHSTDPATPAPHTRTKPHPWQRPRVGRRGRDLVAPGVAPASGTT